MGKIIRSLTILSVILLIFCNNIFCEDFKDNGDQTVEQFRIIRGDDDPDFKGAVSLNENLMTVPGRGGLDYDINLQYIAGNGVPSGESATWVGMGWNLNMYQITCTVAESADGFNSYGTVCNDHFYLSYPGGGTSIYNFSDTGEDWLPLNWSKLKIEAFRDNSDASIPYSKREYLKFRVTDTDGTQYIYEECLSKIESKYGIRNHMVHTTAVNSVHYYDYNYVFKLTEIRGANFIDSDANGIVSQGDMGSWVKLTYAKDATLVASNGFKQEVSYLSSIQTPNYTANFILDGNVQYIKSNMPCPASTELLKDIVLQNNNGQVIKTVTFHTSESFNWLFNGDSYGGGNSNGYTANDGDMDWRMRLDSITIKGRNNEKIPSYRFEYYDNPDIVQSPEYYRVDQWGYAYLTNEYDFDNTPYQSIEVPYWMIKKVVFPTGGSISFNYEPNKFVAPDSYSYDEINGSTLLKEEAGGMRLKEKIIQEANSSDTYVYRYEYSVNTNHPGYAIISCPPPYELSNYALGAHGVLDWSLEYPNVKTILPDGSYRIKYFTTSLLGSWMSENELYYKSVETVLHEDNDDIIQAWNDEGIGLDGNYGLLLDNMRSFNDINILDNDGPSNVFTLNTFDHLWKRGHLTREEYFSSSDEPIMAKLYYYTMEPKRTILYHYEYTLSSSTEVKIATQPGSITSGWARLDKIKTIQYDETGTNSITSNVINEYNDETGMLTKKTETNSDDTQRMTDITYASSNYSAMLNKNMLSQVAQQTVYTGSSVNAANARSSQVTTWKDWGNGCWAPEKTYGWLENDSDEVYSFTAFSSSSPDEEWVLTSQITSRDECGNILTATDGNGNVTSTVWDYNYSRPCTTTVGNELISIRAYDSNTLKLTSVTDANGISVKYEYDGLGRLTAIKDQDGNKVNDYFYYYSRNNKASYLANDPNYIQTRNYRGSTDYTTTKSYANSLGLQIQQQTYLGDEDIIVATSYDDMQRTEKVYRAYQASGLGHIYDSGYATNSASYNGSYPYSQAVYLEDPLGRIKTQAFPGSTYHLGSGHEVDYHYLIEGNYFINRTEDEGSTITDSYIDVFGNTVKTIVDAGGLDLTTKFEYDILGNLLKVIPPEGVRGSTDVYNTIYKYNTLGKLTETTTPDDGTTKYLYDANGNLRLIQDANHNSSSTNSVSKSGVVSAGGQTSGSFTFVSRGQLHLGLNIGEEYFSGTVSISIKGANDVEIYSIEANNEDYWPEEYFILPKGTYTYIVSSSANMSIDYLILGTTNSRFVYYKYDAQNRMTESGERMATSNNEFTQGNADNVDFPAGDLTQYTYRLFYGETSAGQENTQGKLSRSVTYRQAKTASTTYYSYDDHGNIEWQLFRMPEMTDKKVSYTYDLQGNIVQKCVSYGDNSAFYTYYNYDEAGRLSDVYSNTTGVNGTKVHEAAYTYHPTGQIKQMTLGNSSIQTVDYKYNERDWLTDINDVDAIGRDLFGEKLEYYTSNLTGHTDYYNGNISGMRCYNGGVTSDTYIAHSFTYDKANRLLKSQTYHEDAFELTNAYKLQGITYDANGNIKSMVRYSSNASPMDNLSYSYQTGNNKLASIVNSASGNTGTYSYTYDGNGNVLTDSYRGVTNVIYNTSNLPIQATIGGSTNIYYCYDANGNRIRKQSGSDDEIYLVGADGQTEGVFDANGNAKFFNIIAGGETIGRFEPISAEEMTFSSLTLSGTYTANTINTGSGVTVSGTATLRAGRDIQLGAGFSVPSGAVFNALTSIELLNPTRFYYLKDHLGSIRVTVDEKGDIRGYDDYDAWGMVLSGRSGNQTNINDNYKFTGKERDSETGYDYFGARYYESRFGRWTSVDPMNQYNSPYVYVGNNPLKLVDPTGMWGGQPQYTIDGVAATAEQVEELSGLGVLEEQNQQQGSKQNQQQVQQNSNTLQELRDAFDIATDVSTKLNLLRLLLIAERESRPLEFKIGTFSKFRTTYKFFSAAANYLGIIGDIGSLGFDVYGLATGQLKLGRFGYRVAVLGTALYTGFSIGGPLGAATGGLIQLGGTGAEEISDKYLRPKVAPYYIKQVQDEYINTHVVYPWIY